MRKAMLSALMCSGMLVGPVSLQAAGPDFKEGKWSITSQSEIKGMAMQIPPVTFEQCMSKKEIVPMEQNNEENCKILEQKTSGDTVTWRYECKHSKGKGSITYHEKSFSGTMHIETDAESGNMSMTTTMSGTYLGPCK